MNKNQLTQEVLKIPIEDLQGGYNSEVLKDSVYKLDVKDLKLILKEHKGDITQSYNNLLSKYLKGKATPKERELLLDFSLKSLNKILSISRKGVM